MELSAEESGVTDGGAIVGGRGILAGSAKVEDRSADSGAGVGLGVNLASTFLTVDPIPTASMDFTTPRLIKLPVFLVKENKSPPPRFQY